MSDFLVKAAESVGEARHKAAAELRAAGLETPELDARLLLAHLLKIDAVSLLTSPERSLSVQESEGLKQLLSRRTAGEPIARIIGQKEFWSRPFRVGPDTLVPRPETEIVVEAALVAFPDRDLSIRVLDLGTGTGILLAAILLERPQATGLGIDRSEKALGVARENLSALGIDSRAEFVCGDWANSLNGVFDLVVSNPPYISSEEISRLSREVRGYDPWLALDGGSDGLDAYRAIVSALPNCLSENGVSVLELGIGQEAAVSRLAEDSGLAVKGVRHDLAGIPRALILMRKGENNAWHSPQSALVSASDSA